MCIWPSRTPGAGFSTSSGTSGCCAESGSPGAACLVRQSSAHHRPSAGTLPAGRVLPLWQRSTPPRSWASRQWNRGVCRGFAGSRPGRGLGRLRRRPRRVFRCLWRVRRGGLRGRSGKRSGRAWRARRGRRSGCAVGGRSMCWECRSERRRDGLRSKTAPASNSPAPASSPAPTTADATSPRVVGGYRSLAASSSFHSETTWPGPY